jgi:hypothetical protein
VKGYKIRLWVNEKELKDIDDEILVKLKTISGNKAQIASIVSASISFYFEKKIDNRTSKRQFFYDFSRTFFDNPNYRKISIALEEQYLYGRGKIFIRNGGKFSDYDIDNYLYFLYDLSSFAEQDLISYTLVEEQYAYYVCVTYINPEIQGYRNRMLKQGFSDWQAIGYLESFAKLLGISKTSDCKAL